MLRGKKGKKGQMVQFDTIKFRRTILVSSCGLKSHYNSRVSLHEAPTKNSQQIGESVTARITY